MGNIFWKGLKFEACASVPITTNEVEADEYGNGESDMGICQRMGNQAGYGNLMWKTKRHAKATIEIHFDLVTRSQKLKCCQD